MSDLVVQNIANLPTHLQKFAELRIGKTPFRNLKPMQQSKVCLDIITKSLAATGNKGEDENLLVFQSNELKDCLKDKYGELTADEILKALDMLIAGDFGPYMGLYKKSYYQALKGYYEIPERSQSMKQYLAIIEAPKTSEKPLELKIKETKESVLKAFNEFKETGNLPFTAFAYYDFLKEQGKFNWTREEKLEMNNQAEKEYEGILRERKSKGVIKPSQMADLMLNLNTNATFKNICKRIALKRYFDQLINEGKELEI